MINKQIVYDTSWRLFIFIWILILMHKITNLQEFEALQYKINEQNTNEHNAMINLTMTVATNLNTSVEVLVKRLTDGGAK